MVVIAYIFSIIRKGKEPKVPHHASAAATRVTTRNDRLPYSRQE